MPSFDDIADEVTLKLLGYVEDQQQLTLVAADFLSTDMSFTVADTNQVSVGIIEVSDEMMWVSSIDTDSNTVTVIGRGMFGSGAVDHDANEFVRNTPKFPRVAIKQAINDTINSMYPDVYAVESATFIFSPAVMTYDLPGNVEQVFEVSYDSIGPTNEWPVLSRWRANLNSNTGKTIDLLDAVMPGRTVNVFYRTVPVPFDPGNVDNLNDTGLNDSAKDSLVYGACARLVGYLEPSRFSNMSAEAKLLDQQQGSGAALAAGRYFYQMHIQTRNEESRRLLDRYPPTINYNR
jgi:hypothetical protein